MTDEEFEIYKKEFEEYTKEVSASKETARKYLRELGIIGRNGSLTKAYAICTPKSNNSLSVSTVVTKKLQKK